MFTKMGIWLYLDSYQERNRVNSLYIQQMNAIIEKSYYQDDEETRWQGRNGYYYVCAKVTTGAGIPTVLFFRGHVEALKGM